MEAAGISPVLAASALTVEAPLNQFDWLRAGSSTRHLVPQDASLTDAVALTQAAFGVKELFPAFCQQRHTSRVHLVTNEELNGRNHPLVVPECDGLIANSPGVTLAVFTADCVPLILVETRERIIGAVHAGWRGTFAEIAVKAVELICGLGGKAANIHAWIGPSIRGCCYEVSAELADEFEQKFAHLNSPGCPFVTGRYLDLPELNRRQLIFAGVPHEQIHLSGICTKHSVRTFYSYRAEGDSAGRIVSLVARTA
jgi:YfiH family protein